jgi:hypothetical protein
MSHKGSHTQGPCIPVNLKFHTQAAKFGNCTVKVDFLALDFLSETVKQSEILKD